MIFEKLLEKLFQYFAGDQFKDEITYARREFFDQAGIVDQDSNQFEIRMAQFLDWYIFTRENAVTHLPPIQMAFEKAPFGTSEEEALQMAQLVKCHHSLFEFKKMRSGDVTVEDLFADKKMVIRDSYVTAGFNVDEIFDARVVPFEDTFVFCKGFCFHPPEATKFILKEIKKVKHLEQPQREVLMLRLLKMRYLHEQYRHIKIEFVYTNDSKLRL